MFPRYADKTHQPARYRKTVTYKQVAAEGSRGRGLAKLLKGRNSVVPRLHAHNIVVIELGTEMFW